jgi:HK97 family phage major capsid protein
MTIQELRAKLKAASAKIRACSDEYNKRKAEGKDLWPDSTRAEYDAVNKEYDETAMQLRDAEDSEAMHSRINQINEDEQRSTRHGRQMPGLDDRIPGEQRTYGDAGFDRDEARDFAAREVHKRNALRAFMIADSAPHLVSDEMRKSCEVLGRSLSANNLQFRLLDSHSHMQMCRQARAMHPSTIMSEERALSKVTAGLGVELVPVSFITQIELAMIAYGPMLQYVETMTTDTGEEMKWPTGDDASNEGVEVSEGVDVQTLGEPDPTIGSLSWFAYEYISKFIKVPFVLSRDSLISIDLLVATLMGERFGRIFTKRATIGDGVSKIKGIVVDAAAGATSAAAAAIAGDDTINLQQSVDPAYRSNGQFMCHDNVIGALRKLKDTTGNYIWSSGLSNGQPDTLHGRPLIPNPYMASTIATTNITMLYGELQRYKFRRVGQMRLLRLNERFAEKLQTGFLGHISADGKLLKTANAAACPVKKLTQA